MSFYPFQNKFLKECHFILGQSDKVAVSKRYPAEIITDEDYADDQALLINTPAQAESLLHRLGTISTQSG